MLLEGYCESPAICSIRAVGGLLRIPCSDQAFAVISRVLLVTATCRTLFFPHEAGDYKGPVSSRKSDCLNPKACIELDWGEAGAAGIALCFKGNIFFSCASNEPNSELRLLAEELPSWYCGLLVMCARGTAMQKGK